MRPNLRRTGESSGVTASDGSYAHIALALALGFPRIAFNLNTAVVVGDHVAPRLSAARWPAELGTYARIADPVCRLG
ncbi:hypothetical protein [Pseudomonas kurunegalensis]|uniref:hypothetical protein n=1 Tax=Pseudomonas kurunegalensis TaxID=485880 RepID=UPI003557BA2C